MPPIAGSLSCRAAFRTCLLVIFGLLFSRPGLAETAGLVVLETTEGEIVIELFDDKAPASSANFRQYVREGFYDGTLFHRVIPGFMIQAGGFESGMKMKSTRDAIRNESDNGLSNQRGTVAMARTQAPHSATSQFFINLVNNNSLNGMQGRPGYAVFGKVVRGMDVVDQIAEVRTVRSGIHSDVPADEVRIVKATIRSELEGD